MIILRMILRIIRMMILRMIMILRMRMLRIMDLAMGMRGCLVKDINTDNDTVKLCEKVEPGLEH